MRLTLDGDMERYVWFLNGRALWEDDTIPVRAGEVVRFVMINRTMMHHPMHLHGHFFRVVNGQGDQARSSTPWTSRRCRPRSSSSPPTSSAMALHGHLLYHMESGMARVVCYEGYEPGPGLAGGRGSTRTTGTPSPRRRSSAR